MPNQYLTLITISLPIIGGIIGYVIREIFEKKKMLLSSVNIERREVYQKFVNIVVILSEENFGDRSRKFKEELNEFYKKYILYASPNVIIALTDFFELLNHTDKNIVLLNYIPKLNKILFEMRKDLGLKNSNLDLKNDTLLKALLN